MAEATLQLGGKLDIVSGSEFLHGITDMKHHMDSALRSHDPLYRPLMGSIAAPAASAIVPFNYTPQEWQESHILSYAIGINDDHTTASGVTAALYKGDPFNPMLGTVIAPGRPIPDSQFWGPGRTIVHSGEYIFWALYGLTIGTTIWCNMQVAEFSVRAREMHRV